MAQIGLVMRLFAGEFLLIATSDATIQSQSINRALNGILGFNHLPPLPPLCFPVSGLIHVRPATTGHPNGTWESLLILPFSYIPTPTLSASHILTFLSIFYVPSWFQLPISVTKTPAIAPPCLLLASCSPLSASQPQQSLQWEPATVGLCSHPCCPSDSFHLRTSYAVVSPEYMLPCFPRANSFSYGFV